MNNIFILFIWTGIVAIISTISTIFTYRKLREQNHWVGSQIEVAEKELLNDLLQTKISQLEQTRPGRQLLESLEGTSILEKLKAKSNSGQVSSRFEKPEKGMLEEFMEGARRRVINGAFGPARMGDHEQIKRDSPQKKRVDVEKDSPESDSK